MKARLAVVVAFAVMSVNAAAEEILHKQFEIQLPYALLDQTLIVHPTHKDFVAAYKAAKAKLEAGDTSACVNPSDGPWMQVETTAMVGGAVKGVGIKQGRTHVRQVSAAEQALYDVQKAKGSDPCGPPPKKY